MNAKTLLRAESEAREFLERVKRMRADEYSMKYSIGTQFTAAVRRQSMELTRALADLRRAL